VNYAYQRIPRPMHKARSKHRSKGPRVN